MYPIQSSLVFDKFSAKARTFGNIVRLSNKAQGHATEKLKGQE